MIHYLPLEHISQRYTKHLDIDIEKYFLQHPELKALKYYPQCKSRKLKPGHFLESSTTIEFKSKQLADIASSYYMDDVKSGDVIWTSDLWFPGIESIPYLNLFHNKDVKIRGLFHAGSWTDTDSVRKLERWAKNFEDIILDISDKVFVASNFIKTDLVQKRIVDPNKIIVTPFPLDSCLVDYKNNAPKEDIIIFNGRDHLEKQPWLFKQLEGDLKSKYPNYKFIWTLEQDLTKDEYYKLLAKSKIVVSFALQENFGYGVAEATYLGCVPVVPNRLVYPEFYSAETLYETYSQCVELVDHILDNWDHQFKDHNAFLLESFNTLNLNNINTWFHE